jgi:hypothetical protein
MANYAEDIGRNRRKVFAQRTLANIDVVLEASVRDPACAYPITHLANSLMGVLVWLHEQSLPATLRAQARRLPLEAIWPDWKNASISGLRDAGSCTVGYFLKETRDCVAHGVVEFSSDGKSFTDVQLHFGPTSDTAFEFHIRADVLRDVCERLVAIWPDPS